MYIDRPWNRFGAFSHRGLSVRSFGRRGLRVLACAAAVSLLGSQAFAADLPQSGKEAYEKGCASCHTSGAGGAPKVGDHAAWGMRIGQGRRTLYKHTIEGQGTMPPRGGTTWPDATIRAAVDYLVSLNR
jgi:cytochrome c5